jgi:glycosyltransferase involved in cell wall biosynthesis
VADPHYLNNDLALRIDRRVLVNIGLLNWIKPLYSNAGYPAELVERIKVINHKVNLPSSIPNKPSTDFNVIYVGRDAKEKRVDLFLEIASRCADITTIKFHVVGIKSDLSVESNITWHGVVLDPAHIEVRGFLK